SSAASVVLATQSGLGAITLPSVGVVSAAMVSSTYFLQDRLLRDHRDMGGDHLPAGIGKAHPGLHLPPGHVAAAHLVDQRHGGHVASQRQHVEAQALLLGARPRQARLAMGMDAVEAVAVL